MSEPFLPPPAPVDNPIDKRPGGARKVAFWIFLVALFVAIYQLLSGKTPARHDEVVACQWSAWWTVGYAASAITALTVAFLVWQLRGSTAYQRLREPGSLAVAEGQLERAASIFRDLAQRYRSKLSYESDARLSLAGVLVLQGNLAGALEETLRVERRPGLLWADNSRLIAAILLGKLHALRGDLAAADPWCGEARKRLARSPHNLTAAALLRVSEAFTWSRQGRLDEVETTLARDAATLDNILVVSAMRDVWLLRAFAASRRAGVRGPGDTHQFLDLARSQSRGAYDHLAVEWPELKLFLEESGLAREAASS